MVKKKLVLTFINKGGKKSSLSIDDPKEDVTQEQVKAVMDDIVAKNIFNTNGGDLMKVDSARIVQTNTTEFEYAD